MHLAAILGFFLLSLGSLPSPGVGFLARAAAVPVIASNSNVVQAQGASSSDTSSSNTPSSQPQSAPAQNPSSAKNPAVQSPAKPKPTSPKRHAHAKKAIYADCSNAPKALNPVLGAKKVATPDGTQAAAGANTGLSNGTSAKRATPASSSRLKPCPPPKKVVRNGGANEPKIELLGGSPAQDQSSERSTEQITASTEENLKKISERQLSSSQQDTVSQIKQFIEESKQAAAAGDPERAQNLATKARLLSEQLLSP
jgi:hypothetical protein